MRDCPFLRIAMRRTRGQQPRGGRDGCHQHCNCEVFKRHSVPLIVQQPGKHADDPADQETNHEHPHHRSASANSRAAYSAQARGHVRCLAQFGESVMLSRKALRLNLLVRLGSSVLGTLEFRRPPSPALISRSFVCGGPGWHERARGKAPPSPRIASRWWD